MRLVLAGAAAVVVGVLGALVLGEYEFTGLTVLAAAVVFGLFIGEAALATAGPVRDGRLAVAASAVGVVSMAWGAWISTGRDLSFLGLPGWVSIPLAGLTAGVRTYGLRMILRKQRSRREGGTRPGVPAPGGSPEERPA